MTLSTAQKISKAIEMACCDECAHAVPDAHSGFYVCGVRESFRVKVPADGFCHLGSKRPKEPEPNMKRVEE